MSATAEDRFTAAWDAFVSAVRQAQARGARSGDELTLSQYELLRPLEHGAASLGRVAAAAGIAPATVTRVVDGLESAGVVRRARSRGDRRTVRLSLTAEGRRRLEAKRERIAAFRHRLYEGLEPDEREQGERLLRHLAGLLGEL